MQGDCDLMNGISRHRFHVCVCFGLFSIVFFGSFFFVCLISFKVAVDNFIARRIAFS